MCFFCGVQSQSDGWTVQLTPLISLNPWMLTHYTPLETLETLTAKTRTLSLSIKIAQRSYIIGSLGPKSLNSESFEGTGSGSL